MKISIHHYITSTQQFVDLPDDTKDVEDELTKLGYDINNIQYIVLPSVNNADLMQMHDYDKDDYLLIVNGNVWAVSGNDEFYEIEDVAPPQITDDAQGMVDKVRTNEHEEKWRIKKKQESG